jgi:hypothetical protein
MSKLTTLRFYRVNEALQRLVDFHRRATDQEPKFNRELLAHLPQVTAARLYSDALTHAIADLASNETEESLKRAMTVVSFCRANGSLDGLESVYLTSMSLISVRGNPGEFRRSLSILGSVPKIDGLGGGLGAAMYFDASERILSGLSLVAVQGLLDPADITRGLREDRDPRGQVQAAIDNDRTAGRVCRQQLPIVAGIAGKIVGSVYGEPIGMGIGFGLGTLVGHPVEGVLIGGVIGRVHGKEIGAVVGAEIAILSADLICGGSGPTSGPAEGVAPTPGPTPPAAPPPPPSPPPPSPAAPLTDSDGHGATSGGATSTAGGPKDDPQDKEPLHGDGGTMVATPISPYIDRDDPTDRDPNELGRGPTLDQVARVQSTMRFPDRFLDEATRMPKQNQVAMHLMPKFITLNGGATIDMGPVSPYILYTNGDTTKFEESLTDLVNSGRGFVPDPSRPGRVMLNPAVVNPVRDVTRDMLRSIMTDFQDQAKNALGTMKPQVDES